MNEFQVVKRFPRRWVGQVIQCSIPCGDEECNSYQSRVLGYLKEECLRCGKVAIVTRGAAYRLRDKETLILDEVPH